MKFSAQEEYGLRCLLHLAHAAVAAEGPAAAAGESPFLTVSAVAEREGVSAQYAGRLFRLLAKAGVVEGVRGCKGGYALARSPEQITALEVLTALGGKLYEPGLCDRYGGDDGSCVHTSDCSIRSLWTTLQGAIDDVLCRTTLADLLDGEGPVSPAGAECGDTRGAVRAEWVGGFRASSPTPTDVGSLKAPRI